MSDDKEFLIDGYLDGVLSPDDLQRLNDLLKEDRGFAQHFAKASLLHDRLQLEMRLDETNFERPQREVGRRKDETHRISRHDHTHRRWTLAAACSLAAVALIAFLTSHFGAVAPASAADTALDRMIEAASRPTDRIYRIRITDYGPGGPPLVVMKDRNGIKPSVDGAELYVRGSDKFVLLRRFGDGSPFTTGSDGSIGWAAPPTGHVHLSNDTRRFRRAVPGEHDDIPFLDLESGLRGLRRDYELSLRPIEATEAGSERRQVLEGVKRRGVHRGPERVAIVFDDAGIAHRITLSGLPEGEPDDSPRAVELELLAPRDLGQDFFKHESHHAPDRPVDWE